jgi:ABC-type glycerol-3-phosphate transport system substrate-binding protein
MAKPYGMTPTFQIVVPTRMQNQIWDAVQEAVEEGMDPTLFLKEVREAWAEALNDKKKRDLTRLYDA